MGIKQPLVSVIVPVFNVEKYLRECIDSILAQSYNNLEIIIINDGSTDKSERICHEYACKDNRIKILNQVNKGLSSARNLALDIMTGEYVAFVDSDDAVEKDYIKTAINLMESRLLDAVVFEAILIDENSNIIGERFHAFDCYTELPASKALGLIITDQIGSQVWKGIYRSKCWENVVFPVGRLYEDIATTFKIYLNMENSVAFIQDKLYRYRLNRAGISLKAGIDSIRTYHIFMGFIEQYSCALLYCDKNIIDKCFSNVASFAANVVLQSDSSSSEYSHALKFLRTNSKKVFKNRHFGRKRRMIVLAVLLFPNCAKKIIRVKKALSNV